MTFHIVTIFPGFFAGPLDHGVVSRARASGHIGIRLWDLREFTTDRHRTVDDRPFGGGEGMLLKIEPMCAALEAIRAQAGSTPWVVLLSAQGRLLDQAAARRLAEQPEIVLLCGRYEGVDERVAEHLADEEMSVGSFVLSGGELAAALVVDAVARLAPGVLGNAQSAEADSFAADFGILDCPQYTRPAEFRGWLAPPALLSGNHQQVRRWRRQAALAKTLRHRPELLRSAALDEEDRALLEKLRANGVCHD